MGPLVIAAALLLVQAMTGTELAPLVVQIERAFELGDRTALETCRAELVRDPEPDSRYTLAYVDWRYSQLVRYRGKHHKHALKQARVTLEAIVVESPDDAEAVALLGGVYGEHIAGVVSGIRYGRKSGKALDRAGELAPENPRVVLQLGISAFRTPKRFGGDIERAESLLRKAARLFQSEPADERWPYWGRVDVQAFLGQVLIERGDLAGARKAYTQGLVFAPESVWLRDVLIPELDAIEAGD